MIEKTVRITQGGKKQEGKWNGSKLPHKNSPKFAATEQRGCGIYKSEERQNSKKFIQF